MGQATVYCEKCGEMIPQADFAKGKAVHFQSKDYCVTCKAEIAHLIPQAPPAGPANPSKRSSGVLPSVKRSSGVLPSVRRSSGILPAVGTPAERTGSGSHRAVSPARPPTPGVINIGTSGPAPARSRQEDTRFQRKPTAGMSPTAKAALGIAGGVLALIVAVWGWSEMKAKEEAERRAAIEREAAAAVKEVQDYFADHPDDFDRTLEMIELAKRKTVDTKAYAALKEFESDVLKKRDVWKRKEDKKRRLDEIREHGRKTPKDTPTLLADLAKLQAESDALMGEEFTKAVAEVRKGLQDCFVTFVVNDVDAKTADLAAVDSLEPFKKQYTEIFAQCEGLDELHIKLVQAKIQDLGVRWNAVAQEALQEMQKEVEAFLDKKQFDDADKRLDRFPKKFSDTPAYAEFLKLKRKIETARKQAERGPETGGGGTGSGGTSGGTALGGTAMEELNKAIPLHSGTTMPDGWAFTGSKAGTAIQCPFEWDSPEDGVLHGNNPSADAVGVALKGSLRWLEYDFDFDVKCTRGATFLVGILVNQQGGAVYEQDATLPRDAWVHFRIRVTETKVLCERPDRTGMIEFTDAHVKTKNGMIALGISAGGETSFRNITVKVYKLTDK